MNMKIIFSPWNIAGVLMLFYFMVMVSNAAGSLSSKKCSKLVRETSYCKRSSRTYYETFARCTALDLFYDSYYSLDECTCSFRPFGCFKSVLKTRIYYYNWICSKYTQTAVCCPGEIEQNEGCLQGCGDGKFGENCDENCLCPSNALDVCDKLSGNCTCKEGWYGQNCTNPCDEGHYGINCENICRCHNGSECDRVTGSCNCTQPGWTGDYCQIECEPDRFGYNCSGICDCGENEICDSKSGKCMCKAGWTGKNCTNECEQGRYGLACQLDCACNWNNTEQCNSTDGTCICNPGKQGLHCNEDCNPGTYGKQCKNNCTCSSTEFCDKRDGTCWSGFCSTRNTKNCLQNSTQLNCFKSENETMELCTDGNFSNTSGDFEMKLIGFCCNSTQKSDLCLVASGVCECHKGAIGIYCEKDCGDWRYGDNCSNTCDCDMDNAMGCNPVNGECNCSPYWTGKRCTSAITKEPALKQNTSVTTLSASLITISVAAVIVLIVIIIIVMKKRGHCFVRANEENMNNTETVKGEGEMVYSLAKGIEAPQNKTEDPDELNEVEYHGLDRTGRTFEDEPIQQETTYSYMMNSETVDENDYSHVVRGRMSNSEDTTYGVTQKCDEEYDIVKRSGHEDLDDTNTNIFSSVNIYGTN